jgi:hypothetical protein
MNNKIAEDKMLLKELVDKVSILGDQKDFNNQVQLFTENAISETIADGKIILSLEGREVMANAFSEFLNEIETVYHFNGQHLFTIEGDNAKGICYCLITLIGHEEGKKIKNTIGAVYKDDYIHIDNQWYISKRVGNFLWQDKIEIN